MEISEKRQRIFASNGSYEADHYYNYIKEGTVTFQELLEHGLRQYPDKLKYIASQMSAGEQTAWNDAKNFNTVNSYDMFLSMFPNSVHASEAREALAALEDSYWSQITKKMSEQSLNNYKRLYPEGKYVAQCDALVSDLPWIEAKERNTIDAYEAYEANNPGKHSEEIRKAKEAIEDTNYWVKCSQKNTIPAYKEYLAKYSDGLYADEAKQRIVEFGLGGKILEDLQNNANEYSTLDLQKYVENRVITWRDLGAVFSEDQIQAIKDWRQTQELPKCTPPTGLRKNSTEVYFWGTKGTGKTCAIGAVMSYAKNQSPSKMIAKNCSHRIYMDQLSNLFRSNKNNVICNLPESTSKESIAEMNLQLVDDKNKKHNATFIDLAGEVVTGIYKYQNSIPLTEKEKMTIERVLSYLRNPYNNKIHFFVLEYNEEGSKKEVEELSKIGYSGVQQGDVLTSIAEFLDVKGCLRKSTVGVYGLVTKSDRIDLSLSQDPDAESDPEKVRIDKAFDYVNNDFSSFWGAIDIACKKSNIKDVKTIAFSIGDVFAKNLCIFDGSDSMKIVDRLIKKIPSEHEGWFSWLFK